MGILWFLLVGIIAGWLAGTLVKGGGFGLIGNMVIGVIGAMIGGFLFNFLGVSSGNGIIWSIVVATIGAVVLLFIVRAFKKA
ncbi:GlsB/YeaQ/YmgE family stress response membrane protein [Pseudidiomarina marina]|uniref:GlsB/YeaQ/YmgE family stress response membrane protein n=1 Tax=Pseudidiomarina marina TaxID=502366 RepID=UPI00384AA0FD